MSAEQPASSPSTSTSGRRWMWECSRCLNYNRYPAQECSVCAEPLPPEIQANATPDTPFTREEMPRVQFYNASFVSYPSFSGDSKASNEDADSEESETEEQN
eukprot:TRINITY_DN4717_c0_g1_i1.p2 TRINITY_DN4717_c0_g1~~TRINITY_DN4717_c0_g1_i1.p2  ORF type:complete len:115 (+),score=20.54 TRINITY_DN4717_c0_g1_i1:40-345(+)